MGETEKNKSKAAASPFEGMKSLMPPITTQGAVPALGSGLAALSQEEQEALARDAFEDVVPAPSPAVRAAKPAKAPKQAEVEPEGDEDDDEPSALLEAKEQLPQLANAITRGELVTSKGLAKGFKLIAKAFEELLEDDEDIDDDDVDEDETESVLDLKDTAFFLGHLTAVQGFLEIVSGSPERSALFQAYAEKLSLEEQALLQEVVNLFVHAVSEGPKRIAELSEEDEDRLKQIGLNQVQELQMRAKRAIEQMTGK